MKQESVTSNNFSLTYIIKLIPILAALIVQVHQKSKTSWLDISSGRFQKASYIVDDVSEMMKRGFKY